MKFKEAESYAQQNVIKLVDGKVKVEINTTPGRFDEAVKAVSTVGTVELALPEYNGMNATVPITSLITLSEEESIVSIGQRIPPIPAQAGGNPGIYFRAQIDYT